MTEHLAFGTLTIAYDDRVLRPREWTAAQSDWAADLMTTAPGGTVLELCAGAGHIGLLAVAASGRRLLCVDANPVACDYARANAVAAGMAERVEVREGRLEEALAPEETFPVIIADPPWVPREQTRATPRTRSPPSTAATTASTSPAPASRSSTTTSPPAARPCSRSAPAPRPTPCAANPASPRAGSRWSRCANRCAGCSPASTAPEVVRHARGGARRRRAQHAARDDLVGPVAPGQAARLLAAAEGDDGAVDGVDGALEVLHGLGAAEQHRAVRHEHDVGVVEVALAHRWSSHAPSIAVAKRASTSRQVKAPKRISAAWSGSSSARVPQMSRAARCSWIASASTCSS